MVKVETIEGVIDNTIWLHYDMENDVLYLRFDKDRDVPAWSEETDEGVIIVRRQDNDEIAGMTIVNAWKRRGAGPMPDSLQEIVEAFSPWTEKLAPA